MEPLGEPIISCLSWLPSLAFGDRDERLSGTCVLRPWGGIARDQECGALWELELDRKLEASLV